MDDQIVTDNGPQFSAFANGYGMKHARITPYHPSKNGLAEQFV